MISRFSSLVVRVPRRAFGGLLDLPIGRGEETDAVRHAREPEQAGSLGKAHQLLRRHCQSKIYTACSRIRADWSSTVFAHELTARSAGFDAENRLYLFALTMPGEQLLAGAAFATQQHGRIRLRDDADRLHHFPDGRAFSEDSSDLRRRSAGLGELKVERLLQRASLVEEALSLRRQHPVEADGLADQVGDHFEEAEIVVETARILLVPDPDDGEGADHLVVGFDGNAEKRNIAAEPARDNIGA